VDFDPTWQMLKLKGHLRMLETVPASSADSKDTLPETVRKGNNEIIS
jgi:hypothetical protein